MGHRNGGRRPKPAELRRLEAGGGERSPVSHRAVPEPIVVQGREPLTMPGGLPRDAEDAWHAIVPPLERIGLLDGIDAIALEAMCVQYARAKQAGRIVAEQGPLTTGSTGQIVEHPAVAIERNAAAMFFRYAESYGLTPTARTRLGLTELKRRTMADELSDRIGRSPRSSRTRPHGK